MIFAEGLVIKAATYLRAGAGIFLIYLALGGLLWVGIDWLSMRFENKTSVDILLEYHHENHRNDPQWQFYTDRTVLMLYIGAYCLVWLPLLIIAVVKNIKLKLMHRGGRKK